MDYTLVRYRVQVWENRAYHYAKVNTSQDPAVKVTTLLSERTAAVTSMLLSEDFISDEHPPPSPPPLPPFFRTNF